MPEPMQSKTLFVLGAGASKPYGMPLGGELASEIAKRVRDLVQQELRGAEKKLSDTEIMNRARAAARRIRGSRTPTIDTFLRDADDPDNLYLRTMLARIHEGEAQAIEVSDIGLGDGRDTSEGRLSHLDLNMLDDDWISWLFHNRLCTNLERFKENQVAFLSFNYDRLPRLILATMMAHLHDADALKIFDNLDDHVDKDKNLKRFYHINGEISSVVTNGARTANKDARQLQIGKLTEADVQSVSTMYKKEHEARKIETIAPYLKWANRIFFLGLAYHTEITDLFPNSETHPNYNYKDKNKLAWGTAYGVPNDARSMIERKLRGLKLGEAPERSRALLERRMLPE